MQKLLINPSATLSQDLFFTGRKNIYYLTEYLHLKMFAPCTTLSLNGSGHYTDHVLNNDRAAFTQEAPSDI